jgi:hypothetical protein
MAKKNIHKIFEIFQNKYVQIMTKQKNKENANITIEGYLVDCDDKLLYIGAPNGDIYGCIKEEEVFFIQETEPSNEMIDYLENEMGDTPDNETGYN